jgi:phage-related holin
MKAINKILQGYGWDGLNDFGVSLAPSFKYHLGFISITMSALIATLQSVLGLTLLTGFAFMALAFVEVLTGIYASVAIKKQKLQSGKMGRFIIKLALMLICLFVLGAFSKEYKETNYLLGELFTWMRDGVFSFTVIEYLISILENVAVIGGKPNNQLLTAIKKRLDKILGTNQE